MSGGFPGLGLGLAVPFLSFIPGDSCLGDFGMDDVRMVDASCSVESALFRFPRGLGGGGIVASSGRVDGESTEYCIDDAGLTAVGGFGGSFKNEADSSVSFIVVDGPCPLSNSVGVGAEIGSATGAADRRMR